jgi:exopolysaccharide biosynthesis polyprenyl glycosylphosphotransferase
VVALTGVEGVLDPVSPISSATSVTSVTVPSTTERTAASRTRLLLRWRAPTTDLLAVGASVSLLTYAVDLPPLVALLAPLGWALLLLACGAYDGRTQWLGRHHHVGRVLRAGALLGLGCWIGSVLTQAPPASEALLLLLTGTLTVSTLVMREVVRVVDAVWPAVGATRVLVAGSADEVRRTLEELRRDPVTRLEVAGVCLVGPAPAADFDVPVGWGLEELVPTAQACAAGAVVMLPHPELQPRDLQRVGWQLEETGTDLLLGIGLLDVARPRTTLTTAGGLRMLHVRHPVDRGAARVAKGLWERVAAALALLVLAPLLLALALVVRTESEGPALFRQRRIGRGGRSFTMYKFRTMTTDAATQVDQLAADNEGHGVLFKIHADPRVTRVGRVLRRYSLDELPQLVNVALGQMSLVGPRPALPAEVERYDHDPRRRLVVKPGLTGLWQVSGRSDLSWEETVRLDLTYVDNWSLGLDLSIVVRTVRAVLSHRGAY